MILINTNVPNLTNCLALDKALKAKGMKPMETMFWWKKSCFELDCNYVLNLGDGKDCVVPAPLVSEMGERLPAHYMTVKSRDKKNLWHCADINDFIEPGWKDGILAPTEADARCLCLIYLINEGLIS